MVKGDVFMNPAIEVSNLSFSYTEEGNTIQDVSFSIPKGSYTTIIGHNGSGNVRSRTEFSLSEKYLYT